ncbi:alpha/beta-hydrolase [Pholiota conissans]|uniref:Alpha/beta-hydrolase n=1 Tax=Pholiota conissans TaxID=109636 RepID=A0A9P6CV27_9AGAR|nr:alpha/beta-hydrolase [Pholiota conissans]
MGLFLTFAQLPFVIIFSILTLPFSTRNKNKKSLRRVIGDTTYRFVGQSLSVNEVQGFYGTTLKNYNTWVAQVKLPPVIDELGGGSRLLWLGPKRTERVILWCHGGGLMLALTDHQMAFMRYVQQKLEARGGTGVGVALLEYTLASDQPLPTQLVQLISAVKELLASGVQPQNLVLAGDSAGALLIELLLVHTLHPIPASSEKGYDAPPPSPLTGLPNKLAGIYLMCPWIAVTGTTGSAVANSATDSVTNESQYAMGRFVLGQLPEAEQHYIQANTAPEEWFAGADALVEKVLVTSGDKENLFEDINVFVDKLTKEGFGGSSERVKYIVQKDGVHDDPIQDFFAGETRPGKMSYVTPMIVDWLAERIPA